MKMFKSYLNFYLKNILKTSVLLWATKSSYVIIKFHFKQWLCGEEHQYATRPFFSLLKKPGWKLTKTINTDYLIITLITMRLLIFLDFSQYCLACKYEIIFQISIESWVPDSRGVGINEGIRNYSKPNKQDRGGRWGVGINGGVGKLLKI